MYATTLTVRMVYTQLNHNKSTNTQKLMMHGPLSIPTDGITKPILSMKPRSVKRGVAAVIMTGMNWEIHMKYT